MKRLGLAAAIAAFVVPSSASSAIIDQTFGFGGASFFAGDVFSSFNQYNGPETLVGVELIYDYSTTGTLQADFCAFYGDCEPGTAEISFDGTGAFAGLNVQATQNTGFTNSTDALQTSAINLTLSNTFSPVSLLDFMGAGVVAGAVEADGLYDAYATGSGSHTGSVTLRYTTEIAPVPVPAALGLMITGIGGLGLMGLRRRKPMC